MTLQMQTLMLPTSDYDNLEQELERMQQSYEWMSDSVAFIGHELRNPVTGILAGVQAASIELRGIEACQSNLDAIREHVGNLRDTLADVADSSSNANRT